MEWISTAQRMPANEVPVLADIGKKYPIRAAWIGKFTVEVGAADEFCEEDYNTENDTSYWPQGWYEWNENEDTHWLVTQEVTHWMHLPTPPSVFTSQSATN